MCLCLLDLGNLTSLSPAWVRNYRPHGSHSAGLLPASLRTDTQAHAEPCFKLEPRVKSSLSSEILTKSLSGLELETFSL